MELAPTPTALVAPLPRGTESLFGATAAAGAAAAVADSPGHLPAPVLPSEMRADAGAAGGFATAAGVLHALAHTLAQARSEAAAPPLAYAGSELSSLAQQVAQWRPATAGTAMSGSASIPGPADVALPVADRVVAERGDAPTSSAAAAVAARPGDTVLLPQVITQLHTAQAGFRPVWPQELRDSGRPRDPGTPDTAERFGANGSDAEAEDAQTEDTEDSEDTETSLDSTGEVLGPHRESAAARTATERYRNRHRWLLACAGDVENPAAATAQAALMELRQRRRVLLVSAAGSTAARSAWLTVELLMPATRAEDGRAAAYRARGLLACTSAEQQAWPHWRVHRESLGVAPDAAGRAAPARLVAARAPLFVAAGAGTASGPGPQPGGGVSVRLCTAVLPPPLREADTSWLDVLDARRLLADLGTQWSCLLVWPDTVPRHSTPGPEARR